MSYLMHFHNSQEPAVLSFSYLRLETYCGTFYVVIVCLVLKIYLDMEVSVPQVLH